MTNKWTDTDYERHREKRLEYGKQYYEDNKEERYLIMTNKEKFIEEIDEVEFTAFDNAVEKNRRCIFFCNIWNGFVCNYRIGIFNLSS